MSKKTITYKEKIGDNQDAKMFEDEIPVAKPELRS